MSGQTRRSVLSLCAALVLCGSLASGARASTAAGPRVRIVTTAGTIVVVLDPKRAPKTVANFLHYVNTRFYDGGSFFRAVPGFVIQGGNKPKEKPSDPKIPLETPLATGIRNTDGAISMARETQPNTATSEFFICDGSQRRLDGSKTRPGYAAFGHVVSGMDVVRAIARLPAPGPNGMMTTPVTIVHVTVVR